MNSKIQLSNQFTCEFEHVCVGEWFQNPLAHSHLNVFVDEWTQEPCSDVCNVYSGLSLRRIVRPSFLVLVWMKKVVSGLFNDTDEECSSCVAQHRVLHQLFTKQRFGKVVNCCDEPRSGLL